MKLSKRFIIVPVVLAIFSYLFYSAYKDVKDKTLNEFNFSAVCSCKPGIDRHRKLFQLLPEELTGLSKISFISELNDQGRNLLTDFYL